MKTLCEQCFDGVAEEHCMRPISPCEQCGATYSDDNPTHLYVGDPRKVKAAVLPVLQYPKMKKIDLSMIKEEQPAIPCTVLDKMPGMLPNGLPVWRPYPEGET